MNAAQELGYRKKLKNLTEPSALRAGMFNRNSNNYCKKIIDTYKNTNAQHHEQLTVGQFYNKFLKHKQ